MTGLRSIVLGAVLACLLVGPAAASGAAVPLPAISISGNQFTAGGRVVRLIGVNRSGTEYACTPTDDDGIFQGPVDQGSVTAMLGWDINVVQLPLNEACWLGSGTYTGLDPQYTGAAYQQAIESYVALLNANGIYVVLNLSGAAPGDNVFTPSASDSAEAPLADSEHSAAFWTSVASAFKTNDDVLFHVYDEPNSLPGTEDATAWGCVENGCTVNDQRYGSYAGVGDQTLVNAIRNAGATAQPILVSGPNYAGDLSEWLSHIPTDPSEEIAAVIDSFDYSGNFCPSGGCDDDQSQAMASVAASHPVVIGGFGESDCANPVSGFANGLMTDADTIGISYIAWTWDTDQDYGTCNNALLSDDSTYDSAYEDGNPSTYGAIIRSHYQAVAAAAGSTGSSGSGTGSTGATGSSGATGSGAAPLPSLSAPENTAAPVVSGTLVVGRTLTCSDGTWLPSPISFTYRWLRDGTAIPGATNATYAVARADQGHGLTCAVTASDGLTANASSPQRSISAAGTLGHVTVRRATVSARVGCGASNATSCQIVVSLSVSETRHMARLVPVRATATVTPGVVRTLTLTLNRAERRLVAQRHDVTGRLRVSDRVASAARLQIATVTVKLNR